MRGPVPCGPRARNAPSGPALSRAPRSARPAPTRFPAASAPAEDARHCLEKPGRRPCDRRSASLACVASRHRSGPAAHPAVRRSSARAHPASIRPPVPAKNPMSSASRPLDKPGDRGPFGRGTWRRSHRGIIFSVGIDRPEDTACRTPRLFSSESAGHPPHTRSDPCRDSRGRQAGRSQFRWQDCPAMRRPHCRTGLRVMVSIDPSISMARYVSLGRSPPSDHFRFGRRGPQEVTLNGDSRARRRRSVRLVHRSARVARGTSERRQRAGAGGHGPASSQESTATRALLGHLGAVGFRVLALLLASILLQLWFCKVPRRRILTLPRALCIFIDAGIRLRTPAMIRPQRPADGSAVFGERSRRSPSPTSRSRSTRSLPRSAWPRVSPHISANGGSLPSC